MDVDAREFQEYAASLSVHGSRVARDVRQIVSKGALNVKKQLVEEMRGSTSFKGAATAISYDMAGNGFYSEAQIGPESQDGSPGNLANIAYFGTSRGGGTVPDPSGALNAELPRFEAALLALVGDLER